jgi:hypothetical protein
MKLIYTETKIEYVDQHPYATVNAYFYDHDEHGEPPNMPALISLEVGKYLDHEAYLKSEKTTWYMIEVKDLNEAKVIRKAIGLIDKEWDSLVKIYTNTQL